MKKLVIILAMLAFAAQAQAENWAPYGSNDYFTASMDTDTIVTSDNGAMFWTKWNLSPKGAVTMFGKNKKLKSRAKAMKIKWRASCGDQYKQVEELASYTFDKNGNMLESASHTPPISYDIVPGTLMETMHSSVCEVVTKINNDKKEVERKNREAELAAQQAEEEKRRKEIEATEGLVIVDGVIRFNGKQITTDKTATKILDAKEYNLDNKKVHLIRFEYEDSDCNIKYMFITQERDDSVIVSDRFGDCQKSNGIRRKENKLIVNFGGKSGAKQAWEFQNGQVIKLDVAEQNPTRKGKTVKKTFLGLPLPL
jgi:hypothetical protein